MNILELIEKKKNNQEINEQEFDWFVKNILNGNISDYQTSAFLMAIWFANLNFDETYYLTKAIVENGLVYKYPEKFNVVIDKHSTGGVGDKVSLILLPLLASVGVNIAKISGRGLGFTGGTIDKLDSINCKTDINNKEAFEILEKENFFIMQQTNEIVPADKILYAIRDTSGSVDNIALIATSIMSKKIAMNTNYIYLDVKVGDGAFFSNLEKAKEFGKLCIQIGKKFNKIVVVHYTDMDKPLGRCLGNLIEVKEAVEFLSGNFQCKYLKELIFEFASDTLLDLKICNSKEEAYKLIEKQLINKSAFNKFCSWSKTQGSNFNFEISSDEWYKPKFKYEIKSDKEGYVKFLSNKTFGLSLIDLKAGRKNKNDNLDFLSGIYLKKYTGEKVRKDEIILVIYSSNEITENIIDKIKNNISIVDNEPKINKTILGIDR